MGKKVGKGSRLSRCIRAPFKVLACARNLYIRGINECAGRMSSSTVIVFPTAQVSRLPRTYSVSSSKSARDQDLSDLVRVASLMSLRSTNKIELDPLRRQPSRGSPVTGANGVPRTITPGIGRIDEEKPCEFGEDVKVNTDAFPSSRSYAVRRKTGAF